MKVLIKNFLLKSEVPVTSFAKIKAGEVLILQIKGIKEQTIPINRTWYWVKSSLFKYSTSFFHNVKTLS